VEKDGNSIFIFELAGLCIGHLGHLHHTLGADHLAEIGQLDVVMVPVDGAFTMAQSSMIEVLDLLKARIVLPMHYFGPTTLRAFLLRLGQSFEVAFDDDATIEVSATTLPERRTVIVVPELHPRFLE
jgi:L-ascorbate metabolism protein UlaG (beta-lactamase superfamily)